MTNQKKDRKKIDLSCSPAAALAQRDNELVRVRAELRAAKAHPSPPVYSREERVWEKYLSLPPGPERQSYRETNRKHFEGEATLAKLAAFRLHG